MSQYSQWRSFSTADGLGDVEVYTIFESSKGDLWFGTRHGATRFDGRWENFTTEKGLSNNKIFTIAEDDSGLLWFGTEKGISLCNETTISKGPDTLAEEIINVITKDNQDRTWIGTKNGVFLFRSKNYSTPQRVLTVADGLISNYVTDIAIDKNERIWFGYSEDGISMLNTSGDWEHFSAATTGLPLNRINDIFEDRQGNIWLAAIGGGVFKYDGSTWKPILETQIPNNVTAIEQDWDNNFWFATERQVYRFDGIDKVDTFTTKEGLSHESVLDVMEDSNRNMWFATQFAGISRYDGSWRSFLINKGQVTAVEKDNQNNLWFGFVREGVYRYNNKKLIFEPQNDMLENKKVTTIKQASDGTIWIGTIGGGVTCISDTGTLTLKKPIIASDTVSVIIEDNNHCLWIGTNNGVSRYDRNRKSWTLYRTTNSGLINNKVRTIYQDRHGNLWFGTWYGISRYDGISWENFNKQNFGFPSDNILAIAQDSSGVLWFGSMGGGILKFDGLTWNSITTKDGLASNMVWSILYDHHKRRMWFGTIEGLSRFTKNQWQLYSQTSTGLADNWVTSIFMEESLDTTTAGIDTTITFWFGTATGATRYLGESIPPETYILPPKFEIYGIASPYFGVSAKDNLSLPDEISYSYLITTQEEKNILQDWSDFASGNTLVVESPLQSGKYKILVRARDGDNNVDPTPAAHQFIVDVNPPTVAITSPKNGSYISLDIPIIGIVMDSDLLEFKVDYRLEGTNDLNSDTLTIKPLTPSNVAVSSPDTLAMWYMSKLPKQIALYHLRLTAIDKLVHVSSTEIMIHVDSTSIVESMSDRGDIIRTPGGEVELYVPPQALSQIHRIRICSLDSTGNFLQRQSMKVLGGYRVSVLNDNEEIIYPQPKLQIGKQGTITIYNPLTAIAPESGKNIRLLYIPDNPESQNVSGTFSTKYHKITAPFTGFGKFFIVDTLLSAEGFPLDGLTCRPRIFTTTNNNLSDHTDILFKLGEANGVTIKIYNVAGRLINNLLTEQYLPAGENVISWYGLNDERQRCTSGLYIICVLVDNYKKYQTISIINK